MAEPVNRSRSKAASSSKAANSVKIAAKDKAKGKGNASKQTPRYQKKPDSTDLF
jgi:hypothetical protein